MDIDFARIAELSRLYFTADELEEMKKDMTSIIELMDSLRNVELPEGITDFSKGIMLPMLRDDNPRSNIEFDLLMPEKNDYAIPRIIE
jgi:aspartyl/glutamyl-tRNA(Asn/Gln) amidotransferase C subunit